jgi:UDP-glucose 4-epimerase
MKVFITGIAGFLGSRIAEQLLAAGHAVEGNDTLIGGTRDNIPEDAEFYQVDCCYLNAMKNLVDGFDVVIHTASTAYEGLSVFSPHLVCQNTFQISTTVLSACASAGVRRFVNCSSMARYGEQETIPFTEEMTVQPVDPYGIAKVAAEQVMTVLAGVHGFEYINFVPHNIIGAGQKYDDPYRNVASIMINLMLQGRQPYIYGDGSQKRCFSDVRDILPMFEKAITSDHILGETINIGPDEELISILELAELIADILNFPGLDPVFVDPRPCEVQTATCSADKARRLLDYKTTYTLRESLENLAAWIQERGPKRFRYHLNVEITNEMTPKTWTERLFERKAIPTG